jgi:recombination protein RecT
MTQVALFTEKKIFEFLSPKKDDIIKLMGGELAYKKEISFAIQAANANSQLQKATPESVCKAIYNLSITGLSLNPVLKLAYLTPRANSNGQIEANLTPSYQGLVKLLADCGCVKQVYAHCRYEGDAWLYELGTEITIKHCPEFKSKEILGVYAIAVLPNGEKIIEYMPTEEVHGIRARSDGYRAYVSGKIKSTPWVTDEQEMFRKTAIRRIFKYVPKTAFYNKVAEAIALDEVEYPATMGQESYIQSLLINCSYDAEAQAEINAKLEDGTLTSADAESIISDLKNNQLDPVTQGPNHSLTDAKDAAKR